MLLIGAGAALLAALFEGSQAVAERPDVLLAAGTAVVVALSRSRRA